MIAFTDVTDFSVQAHQLAVEKGFWDNTRNKKELFMLVITELSEAVEAHRHNKVADWATMKDETDQVMWPRTFVECIKDTPGDELADATIRLLDLTMGFKITLEERAMGPTFIPYTNFAEGVLELVRQTVIAATDSLYQGFQASHLLTEIISFCEQWKIPLIEHMEAKLKYNNTRAYKHGKAY